MHSVTSQISICGPVAEVEDLITTTRPLVEETRRLVELLRDGRGLWLGPKPVRDLRDLLGEYVVRVRVEISGRGFREACGAEAAWAGETPIITMTDMAIPGLGDNFSTRVVIFDGMYAGTWAHGPVKGHMYGTITKVEDKKEEAKVEKK